MSSCPSSSLITLKSFSVGEFFKISLEQYLLLRCSLFQQTLETTQKSQEKRSTLQDFMGEFATFGKLVMSRNLKHYQTTIADIVERNLIIDFSMLRTRAEELSLDVPNRCFKKILLSLDKMDLHVIQLFTRLLCLRLMYEHLSQAEKVPKGANYRDKFDGDLNKHIDQIKVLGRMGEQDGELLILSVVKCLLSNCISIEFYKYLLNLCNRNELSKDTRKYIRQEYQKLSEKFSVRQQPNQLPEELSKTQLPIFEVSNDNNNNIHNLSVNHTHNGLMTDDYLCQSDNKSPIFPQQQPQQLLQSNQNNNNNINPPEKRRLFTSLFVKNNSNLNSDTKSGATRISNATTTRFSSLTNDMSLSRLIEEEHSFQETPQNTTNNHQIGNNNHNNNNYNNNNINNSNYCEQTNHIPKTNLCNLKKPNDTTKLERSNKKNISKFNNNSLHNSHNDIEVPLAHHEENTQFNLLNFTASHLSQNHRKSIDFIPHQLSPNLSNEEIENPKKHSFAKGASQILASVQTCLSSTAGIQPASKVLSSSTQRQLMKPMQSGRTMYSQNKVIRNSQPKGTNHSGNKGSNHNHRKSQDNHHNSTNNILQEAAQKLLLEQDIRRQSQMKVMSRESNKYGNLSASKTNKGHQKSKQNIQLQNMVNRKDSYFFREDHSAQGFNSTSKENANHNGNNHKNGANNANTSAQISNPILNRSLSEDETSLPLMYMWGHN